MSWCRAREVNLRTLITTIIIVKICVSSSGGNKLTPNTDVCHIRPNGAAKGERKKCVCVARGEGGNGGVGDIISQVRLTNMHDSVILQPTL